MKIEHLAFWVNDLETIRAFYMKYFGMTCGNKYHNPRKQFSSYFLGLDEGGARIEIMHRPDIAALCGKKGSHNGITHLAISVGSREAVDALTERLRSDHFVIEGEPRTTGDGYYESIVLDPEGNLIEITI